VCSYYGYSVQQTSDGGYIVSGTGSDCDDRGYDLYLLKTHPNGDVDWVKKYGGTDDDRGYCVRQTSDGGYIVAGVRDIGSAGADEDAWVIKTDENGDIVWTRVYGGTDDDCGYAVEETPHDGGYVIAGSTMSSGAGWTDVYLIKTDANGDTLWTGTYGGTGGDEGFSVHVNSDTSYIIAGRTDSYGIGQKDVYIIRTISLAAGLDKGSCPGAPVSMWIHPNPCGDAVHIRYHLPEDGRVRMAVYNLMGQEVCMLADRCQRAGEHSATWDRRNSAGATVSSGLYMMRLDSATGSRMSKVLIVK
jgi:hypothetical protein